MEKFNAALSTTGKKNKLPLIMGGNRQALVTVTGSGSCLHLGQRLPRRSLCRPVCHFGKNLPTEGWPLKTSEGGSSLVILQLGGVSGPRSDSKDRTGYFCISLLPSAPQPHKTAKQRWPQNMQRLQCQAWEQVRPEQLKRAEHRRQGRGGSRAEVGARRRASIQSPVFLGACSSGSRWALADGQRKSPRG